MTMPSRVSLSGDALCQQFGGELVVLDLSSDRYYALDGVGARLWELFTENGSTADALATIVAEYDVDTATAKGDLQVFIERLTAARLISIEA